MRVNILSQFGGASIAIIIGLLAGACGEDKPAWSQLGADMSNSGQTLAGAIAKQSSTDTQIGTSFESSPVNGPDGSVYVGTITLGSNPLSGDLVRLSGSTLAVLNKHALGGLISTPAIDQAGNIYVALMKMDGTGGRIISLPPDLSKVIFDTLIPNAGSLSSPKILDLGKGKGSLIFEAYTAASGNLFIVNEQGMKLRDDQLCVEVEGGGSGFQVPGFNLPSTLDPSVGIRLVDRELFLVMPSNRCGVLFFSLAVGQTSSTTPVLTRVGSAENDVFYSSPAISVDGIAVINDSDGNVTGYDVHTENQLWQFQMVGDLFTNPVLMPPGELFAYSVSSAEVSKVELATGSHSKTSIIEVDKGPPVHLRLIGSMQASPAVGGSSLYVSTQFELATFDLNLGSNPVKFHLAGDSSSPAVGANGQVYVGTADGKLLLFPGL